MDILGIHFTRHADQWQNQNIIWELINGYNGCVNTIPGGIPHIQITQHRTLKQVSISHSMII